MRRSLITLLVVTAAALAAPGTAAALPGCDKYAASSGNDAFPGTAETPYLTIQRLADSLTAGKTGCVRGPDVFAGDVRLNIGGSQNAPIVLRSENPSERATLLGRLWIPSDVDHVTVEALTLDGSTFSGIGLPVDGDDVHLVGNEIRNDANLADSLPCLFAGATPGTGAGLVVEGNRIHNCQIAVGLEHTRGAHVFDNQIYDNRQRGIEMYPDADRSLVENNVADANEDGVQFGGSTGSHSDLNHVGQNIVFGSTSFNLGANFEGAPGTGNTASDNCLGPTAMIQTSAGFTATNNLITGDPGYVDRSGKNFTLQAGSVCAGRGPRPGVTTGDPTVLDRSSATLAGSVNPHFQPASYFVEFGTSVALGTPSGHENLGGAAVPTDVDIAIAGLQPSTTYHYRFVAENPSGGRREGAIRSFTTPALPDRDGDGVPDERDICPGVPRGTVDANGDGCADDSDLDSVPDAQDQCDLTPRGPIDADSDGCPDNRDGDFLVDADDGCPTLPAGRFDTDRDGCPGPMAKVRAGSPTVRWALFTRGRRITGIQLRAVRMAGVQKGARVRITCSRRCKVKGTVRQRRRGKLNFKRHLPRRIPVKSVITVRVTKAGLAGRVFRLKFNRREREFTVTERCIPIGSSKPAPLSACAERTS